MSSTAPIGLRVLGLWLLYAVVGFIILRLAVHLFRYGSIQYSSKLSIAGTFRNRSPLTGK